LAVPNVLHESVKRGEGESANEVVKTEGDKPQFDFKPKNHEQLGETLDLIDSKTAAFTSGSRFYYLKNDAVRLEFALVNWLMQKYTDKGFTPITTPVLVREHMLEATGFFPADKNEIYHVNPQEDDLYLVGTSEVTLAGLHMNEPIAESDLPKRYVGFSTCFRREAGSYGKDTSGIFRVHQFDKVEMYSFAHPDKSWEEHDFLLSIEEEILQELGLHYQVINIGSGDLGASAAKKYDCEVWLPGQQRYRELTSCSNTTDFQARRGDIKFRNSSGQLEYAHTLNGTAMASTRTIIAILENYQTAEGRVIIPDVLRPYMNEQEQI
jgi:seryl-tRNA synthetase